MFFRAELNLANSRGPRARVHDRPLDLRQPASPPVRSPPVTSHHAECRVVAKATVEVGLVIAVLITHVTAARRCASRRVDDSASVGVVIITSAAARCIPFVVRLIWRRTSTRIQAGFWWALVGFCGLWWVLLGFIGFWWALSGFIRFYRGLSGFEGFYLVLCCDFRVPHQGLGRAGVETGAQNARARNDAQYARLAV